MSLIQSLPEGPLDIVGDIHGEFDALLALLSHLGYDLQGHHPQGRRPVFVGDFCDRGPDSPAVLALVQKLVQSGRAAAVLGNHEINLLREDAKDGSGWFFDARVTRDHDKYAPFQRPTPQERQDIVQFLSALPIGLERADLRVIHAAWQDEQIEAARRLPLGSVRAEYDQWEHVAQQQARETALAERMAGKLDAQDEGLTERGRRATDRGAYSRFARAVADAELSRFIHADYQAERFSYTVDTDAIAHAERFDGKLMRHTNVTDFGAAEIVSRYKSLADIEHDFRVLKSDIEIASVYHRLPERIRAHAQICFLALVLYRVMRMRLKARSNSLSPTSALQLLGRIQQHRATIGEHTYRSISRMTAQQTQIFQDLNLQKPASKAL